MPSIDDLTLRTLPTPAGYEPLNSGTNLISSDAVLLGKNKIDNLANAREYKIQQLADKTRILTTVEDKGKQASYGEHPERVNYKTPDELQYELGEAATYQRLTRADGSKYEFRHNPDGTYAHDANGQWIEDDVNTKASPSENLYIDDTAQGNMKLGLARSDISKEARDAGITPFIARYMDKTHYNPYEGTSRKVEYNDDGTRKMGYDGTPGPMGVTRDNGALVDIELPESLARVVEYDTHTNVGQLASRAMGQGPKTDKTTADFGAGQSEYTTPDAPMWNNQYDISKAKIDHNTVLPKQVSVVGGSTGDKTTGQKYTAEELNKMLKDNDTTRSWEDAFKDTALQVMVGSENLLKNIGDTYGLATGDMGNFVSRTADGASKFYSNMYSQELKNMNTEKAKKVAAGVDELDKAWIATKENFSNPALIGQLVTESIPMMVGAMAEGQLVGAAKLGVSAVEGMMAVGAVQQGVDMGQEVYHKFLSKGLDKIPDSYWENNKEYQKNVKSGMDSEEAKHNVALDIARVVAGASGLLSYGVNKFMPGGHAIEDKLVGIGQKSTGLVKSTLGESVTEGIEEGGGKAFQNIGVQQVDPTQSTWKDVGQTTADAMAAGGATNVTLQGPSALGYGVQASKELIADKLGNAADVDNTERAATATGRKTRFETDPTTVPAESKPAFAKDILEHASDLWLSPSNREGTQYEKKPTAILDDAVDYLSKMYDVKSNEGKGIIEAEVAKYMFDLTNSKDNVGKATMPKEQKESVIQTLLDKFKGNSQVEYEAEKYYKQQLEDQFKDIRVRLAQEGINPDDLRNKGLLTKDELGNLETVLADMRRMGSEELTSVADSIGSALSARQERLGSEEGDGPKGPNKKTSAEVSAEIETLGFLTRGKKSLRDHTRDITAAINNPMISDKELDESIGALESFVVSRNNKVNIFDTKGDAVRVRSIGEIRTFAKDTMVDNDKITSTITGLLESSADKHVKSRLGDLLTSLQGTNEELKYILDSKNSRAADKALYEYLYEKQLKVFPKEKEILDKFLNDKYGDVPTKKEEAVKIPEVTTAPVEPSHNDYIKQLEVKEAEGTLTEEELNTLTEHYSNIMDDYVNNLDLSSLEDSNSNEKGAVEDNSVNKADDNSEEIDTEAVDKATNFKKKEVAPEEITAKQNLDMHKSLLDATETLLAEANEVLKTNKEVESKLAPEYAAIEGAKRKIETIGGIKESITAMKNAIKYYQSNLNAVVADKKATMNKLAILDNSLKDHMKELDKLKAQFSKLENSIDSKSKDLTAKTSDAVKNAFIYTVALLKKAIANLKARLEKIGNKILDKNVDIADTKSNIAIYKNTIAEADKYITEFEDAIATLKNNMESTHIAHGLSEEGSSELEQAYTKLDTRRKELLAKEGLTLDEVKATREEAKALRAEVKKYKEAVEVATKQAFRQDIENVLGDIVKPNNSTKAGLSNRLFNGATAEELMEIMPNVISQSKNGLSKVKDALKYFSTYENDRTVQGDSALNRFIDQAIANAEATELADKKMYAVLQDTEVAKLFNTKEIESKLAKSVNVASAITLDSIMGTKNLRGEQLTNFVEGAFGALWGNDYSIKELIVPDLELMVQNGTAVPIATFYREAGARLLDELEIRLDLKPQQIEDVTRALGVIVIDNMYARGRGSMPVGKSGAGLSKEVVRFDYKNLRISTDKGFVSGTTSIKAINVRDYKFKDELNTIARVFEYAGEKSDGNIGFSPYVGHKEGDLGRNSNTPLTKKEADYLNLVGSKAWTFEGSGLKELLEQADGDIDKLVVNMLGTKQDVLDSVSMMKVESEIAKYESEELDIRRMMMAYDLVGDEGKFYMDWDFTVSNRAMLANKMINPQNSKISRFIISTEGMRTEVTTEDLNDVLLAMAQAFEIDPDKKSDKDVVEEFRKEIANVQVKNGQYIIEGELSDKLNNVLESDNTLEAIRKEFGKEVSSKNIMHIYQAVELIQKIKNGEPLKTNLALEIDGITNGMATTVLQMGLIESIEDRNGYTVKGNTEMPKKAGIYIDGYDTNKDGDVLSNHAEFRSSNGEDFYQTPTESFKEALTEEASSDLTELVTELVGTDNSKWRKFLKPLVMVFAYGAGVKNISKAASRNLALEMIAKAKSEKELQTMINTFRDGAKIDNVDDAIALNKVAISIEKGNYEMTDNGMPKFVPNKDGKLYIDQDSLLNLISIIDVTMSKALPKAFLKEFGSITKYRQTLKVVNQLNYIASVMSFKDKANGRNYNELTKEEITEINKEMQKDGTYYGAINPNGGIQDYFNTQSMANTEGNKVSVKISNSTLNMYYSKGGHVNQINQIVKDLASNVGATGVIDVHSVDGATMINGHVQDVLNIFDALVMGVGHKNNAEQARMMNEVYYQINMQHSIVGNAVNKVLSGASYKYLQNMAFTKPHEYTDLLTDFNRIFGLPASENMSAEDVSYRLGDVLDMLDLIDTGRRDLVNREASVNQYYVSDEYPAAKWDNKELGADTRYAVFSNDEDTANEERYKLQDLLSSLGELISQSKKEKYKNRNKLNMGIIIDEMSYLFDGISDPDLKAEMKEWLKNNSTDDNIQGCK